MKSRTKFSRFALFILVYTLPVILWGAFVRASGSGDGCGAHWPLCDGEKLIPTPTEGKTWVEYAHRATSGLLLPLVLVLVAWAFAAFERGHSARRAAVGVLIFTITEALLGAALVIKEMVAFNTAPVRAVYMGLHLLNTFVLLAVMALTAWWGYGNAAPQWRGQGKVGAMCGFGVFIMLLVGISGSVAALGDTLFPVATFAEGVARDGSPLAHIFERNRAWHPLISIFGAFFLTYLAFFLARERKNAAVRKLSLVLIGIVALQTIIGVVNVLMAAPIPMQLVHLFFADMLWLALVLLIAAALGVELPQRSPAREVNPQWEKSPSPS